MPEFVDALADIGADIEDHGAIRIKESSDVVQRIHPHLARTEPDNVVSQACGRRVGLFVSSVIRLLSVFFFSTIAYLTYRTRTFWQKRVNGGQAAKRNRSTRVSVGAARCPKSLVNRLRKPCGDTFTPEKSPSPAVSNSGVVIARSSRAAT